MKGIEWSGRTRNELRVIDKLTLFSLLFRRIRLRYLRIQFDFRLSASVLSRCCATISFFQATQSFVELSQSESFEKTVFEDCLIQARDGMDFVASYRVVTQCYKYRT